MEGVRLLNSSNLEFFGGFFSKFEGESGVGLKKGSILGKIEVGFWE